MDDLREVKVPSLLFATGFSDTDQQAARMAFRVRVLGGDEPAKAAAEIAKLFEAEYRPFEGGFLVAR